MSDSGDIIQIDSFTIKMIQHLRDHAAEEPEVPEEGRYEHEEMSAMHYEWSRTQQAIRLLIGVQLVSLALEQL